VKSLFSLVIQICDDCCIVKNFSIGPVLLVAVLCPAQQRQQPAAYGVIYGAVISEGGKPAKGLALTASPWGVAVNGGLPRTRTNNAGEYRFNKLPRWGRYVVYADDEKVGYSRTSTGPIGNTHPTEIAITAEHPEAEFNLYLPPKAGFIRIHLTNRTTGSTIRQMMTVWVSPMEEPAPGLFTMSCYSDHVILVPPDQNLLLHVKADGFSEWDESVGTGKPINVPSGGALTLNVQLDPTE
jgi:hypothetical protein